MDPTPSNIPLNSHPIIVTIHHERDDRCIQPNNIHTDIAVMCLDQDWHLSSEDNFYYNICHFNGGNGSIRKSWRSYLHSGICDRFELNLPEVPDATTRIQFWFSFTTGLIPGDTWSTGIEIGLYAAKDSFKLWEGNCKVAGNNESSVALLCELVRTPDGAWTVAFRPETFPGSVNVMIDHYGGGIVIPLDEQAHCKSFARRIERLRLSAVDQGGTENHLEDPRLLTL